MDAEAAYETQLDTLWINQAIFILINALHCSMTTYYLLYELLAEIFAALGYPKLPEDKILGSSRQYNIWIIRGSKLSILLGSALSLIGSANMKLRFSLFGWLMLVPFPIYDLYLKVTNHHQETTINDFLLFQVLFSSLLKPLRLILIIVNFSMLLQAVSF